MNKAKNKGTTFETAVARYFQSKGFGVERRALRGINDGGDLSGLAGWALECKNHYKMTLSPWVDQARRSALNSESPFFAVIHKRVGHPVNGSYCTMPLEVFVSYLQDPTGLTK